MTENLIESIKKISSGVKDTQEPVSIVYGSVISENPLKILTGQKMILDEKRLILADSVRKIEKTVEIDWNIGDDDGYGYDISGIRKMTEHNGLKTGEKVLMLKMQGGQKYVVLSRVVI